MTEKMIRDAYCRICTIDQTIPDEVLDFMRDTSIEKLNHALQLQQADVSNSTVLEKPIKENYGWHTQNGFDDEPSGWLYEGGEEAYYEALKKWEAQ